jgi:hypothetical protein
MLGLEEEKTVCRGLKRKTIFNKHKERCEDEEVQKEQEDKER